MKIYGVDTLELNIKIKNYLNNFGNFLVELDKKKKETQEKYQEVLIDLSNTLFVVKPKGQGFYSYKLECENFHICFMNREIEKTAPIHVKFLSSFLWQYNFKMAYILFKHWFENTFQLEIFDVQISRLDVCCDTDEINFKPIDNKKFITRAKKREIVNVDSENYEGKNFSGFTIAKGSPLMCRIYNKTLEIKRSNKIWFEEIWNQYGWCGNTVWRIEFQARRKVLKEFNINNMEDIENKIAELWTYYTFNWCTLRKIEKDTNMSRWKIDNRWKKIQKIDLNYNIKPLSREKIKKGDEEILLNLCLGTLTSLSAIKGYNNPVDTYKYLLDKMNKRNKKNNTTYEEEVIKKMNRYIKS